MSPLLRCVALYARCCRRAASETFAASGFAVEIDQGLRWRVGLSPQDRFRTQGTTRTEDEPSLLKALVEADAFFRTASGSKTGRWS